MIPQKYKSLIYKQNPTTLYFYILSSFFVIIFETLSIGSIPIFALALTDNNSFITNYTDNIELFSNLKQLPKRQIIIYSGLAVVILFFIKNIILILINYLQQKIFKEYKLSVSKMLFKYYINSEYKFFLYAKPSKLTRTLTTDVGLAFNYFIAKIVLLREFTIVAIILIFIISVSPLINLGLFSIFFIFNIIFYFIIKKTLKKRGEEIHERNAKRFKILSDTFLMIKQIKINNKENFFTNDFFQNTKKIINLVFFNNFFNTFPKTVMEMVSVLVIVCFSLLLILYNKPDAYVISVVSLLVASGARFIPAFNLITQSFSKTRWLQPSFDLITKEMRNYIQINEENKYLTKDDNFTFEKEISFKNFTFGYNERNILDGINFEIKKGSCIGIIGESGEGKSTLVNLIMGLLKTEKNNVYIDGKSIEKNIYNWQQNIGYIPQDVYLMDASIKDNIAFGIEEKLIDEKRIEELIDQLNLRKFVDSFPKKLNENVGNMAVKISGGQKQRLGIARALYINPKVLIFDEATSSLDIDNENKIIEIIKRYKKNKTIILVSHRSNTLKYCDKIYEIKKGTISEKKN